VCMCVCMCVRASYCVHVRMYVRTSKLLCACAYVCASEQAMYSVQPTSMCAFRASFFARFTASRTDFEARRRLVMVYACIRSWYTVCACVYICVRMCMHLFVRKGLTTGRGMLVTCRRLVVVCGMCYCNDSLLPKKLHFMHGIPWTCAVHIVASCSVRHATLLILTLFPSFVPMSEQFSGGA